MGERWRGPRPSTWRPGSERGQAVLDDVRDRYRQHEAEDTLPRSGRGIFYDLRPRGFGRGVTYLKRSKDRAGWWDRGAIDAKRGRFGPMEAGPDYVQNLVADARRAGLITENWVEDARAPDPLLPDVWASPDQFAAAVARQARDFRLDRQGGQPVYVEVWCEAGDLMARLNRVAGELSVPLYSGGGFDGLKAKRRTADRILWRWRERRQRTVVLEVSDFDLHGLSMVRARDEDIAAWVGDDAAGLVTFERIALTVDQARDHELLDADGKAEVDGLPVPVMDAIVREAIDRHHVPARREQVTQDEHDARDRLPNVIRAALDDND